MKPHSRAAQLTSWHADWSGLRVLVLGLGVTGFAAADTLAELGAEVTVWAPEPVEERMPLLEVIGARFIDADPRHLGAALSIDRAPELVIVSPGLRPRHPAVLWALGSGAEVWGDVELAWRLRDKVGKPAPWLAITGSNGKTTTAQLTTEMLVAEGYRAIACGNIGIPVLDAVRDPVGWDALVVELSSFQLHYLTAISPHASVCLNFSADHLDWHGNETAYRAAKARVYENTQAAAVYNRDDPATRDMVEDADVVDGCRAIGFGWGIPGLSELGVVEDILCDRAFIDNRRDSALELATLPELAVRGLAAPHLVANILAAASLARSVGVSAEAIHKSVLAFHLDPHRTQVVATHRQITWVDDSKATNVDAAQAALRSARSVVWVAGGILKGAAVGELVATQAHRLRAVILIGADRSEFRDAFSRHAPDIPVFEADGGGAHEIMRVVVERAAQIARAGDVVLLAPAAASMDQFVDYAERGTRFADAVRDHIRKHPDDVPDGLGEEPTAGGACDGNPQ